jgi:DNA-binding response OmpR family regulator
VHWFRHANTAVTAKVRPQPQMGWFPPAAPFIYCHRCPMSDKTSSVLIIDDDELLIMLLEHKLEQRGLNVQSASDGRDGLLAAIESKPDLVVLDVMMPTMDGFEVLRRLKEHTDTREIPVIMLSAKRLEDDVVNGLNLGAADYLVKPFMPEELLLKIQRLLRDKWMPA